MWDKTAVSKVISVSGLTEADIQRQVPDIFSLDVWTLIFLSMRCLEARNTLATVHAKK